MKYTFPANTEMLCKKKEIMHCLHCQITSQSRLRPICCKRCLYPCSLLASVLQFISLSSSIGKQGKKHSCPIMFTTLCITARRIDSSPVLCSPHLSINFFIFFSFSQDAVTFFRRFFYGLIPGFLLLTKVLWSVEGAGLSLFFSRIKISCCSFLQLRIAFVQHYFNPAVSTD